MLALGSVPRIRGASSATVIALPSLGISASAMASSPAVTFATRSVWSAAAGARAATSTKRARGALGLAPRAAPQAELLARGMLSAGRLASAARATAAAASDSPRAGAPAPRRAFHATAAAAAEARRNPYDVLGVDKSASKDDVKKA
jgi:hypothetical protein